MRRALLRDTERRQFTYRFADISFHDMQTIRQPRMSTEAANFYL